MSVLERNVLRVLGCPLHDVTSSDLVAHILHRAPRGGPCRTIVPINAYLVALYNTNDQLASAIDKADILIADGAPVVWASRWLDAGVTERITGIGLMEQILTEGAKKGLRVFLLGSTQERLGALHEHISRHHQGIRVAGAHHGFFSAADEADVAGAVSRSGADILFVAMPSPQKEIWTEHHRKDLKVPFVLSVGGAFDVIAGFVPRAPRLFQQLGLEWLWRVSHEPLRLGPRYARTAWLCLILLARELVARRRQALDAVNRDER